jgi:nitroreductase
MSAFTTEDRADVVERVVRERHSCRAFLPDPVPEETLQRMFDTAQRAPSWCGVQPWGVTLTSGQATRDFATALGAHAAADSEELWHFAPPEGYYGIYQERRRATGWALYDSMGVTREDTEGRRALLLANFAFFGAPHVAVITTERDLGIYGAIDTGAYLGALTIIAQSLGVATIVQAAIASYSPFVHDYLGLPDHRQIVCGISLGFEDTEHPINGFRTGREQIDNVVTRLG